MNARPVLAVISALVCRSHASRVSAASDPASLVSPQGQVKNMPCKKCGATGRLPCPEHKSAECELELGAEVLYCSALMDCPVCAGTGFIVCTECKDAAMAAHLAERKASLAARRVALKPTEEKMGRKLRIGESPHFVLVWELDSLKINRKHVAAHELLHIYLKRLERLYDDYVTLFAITDAEFKDKSRVYVWGNLEDQMAGSVRFAGQGMQGGVKRMGDSPAYSVCGGKQYFQGDDMLHRNLVHCVTHLLLSAQKPAEWIGHLKSGWVDEGLAHWFEDKYWGMCDNYCFQEADTSADFKSGKFKLAMRKLASMDQEPPISEVFQQNSDTLTLPMHAAALSYVDFLLARDSKRFNELCVKLRSRVATRDALQATYGLAPLEMQTQWKAWVLSTYPTR